MPGPLAIHAAKGRKARETERRILMKNRVRTMIPPSQTGRGVIAVAVALVVSLGTATAETISQTGAWPGYTRHTPAQVVGDNSIAYLVAYDGLQIFDLSSPAQPQALSFLPCLAPPEAPADIRLQSESNQVCIGAVSPNQLKGIDVSVLANPVQVWTGGLNAQPNQICLNEARVYSSHANLGMSTSGWGTSGDGIRHGSITAFGRVEVVGNRLYVPTASGFQIFDKSDFDPAVGTFNAGVRVNALAVEGQYAYLAARDGLRIVDLQNEAAPTQVGFLQTAPTVREATGIELPPGQSHAYLTFNGTNALLVANVASASSPAWAGAYEFAGPIKDYSVSDGRAFVLARNSNGGASEDLQVLNLADPGNPTLQTRLYANGFTRQLALQEDTLFAADGDNGLCILDVGTPSTPRLVGHQIAEGMCVAAADHHAYVGAGGGFSVFDVSDPENAVLVTNSWPSSNPIAVAGDYFYRVGGWPGMQELVIADVRNSFAQIGTKYRNEIRALSTAGDQFALVVVAAADWEGGLVSVEIIDAQATGFPTVTNYISDDKIVDAVGQVDGSGTNAFLATTNGLEVLDLSNTSNVTPVGQWDCPSGFTPHLICVSGDRIGLASTNHLWVIDRNELGGGDPVIAETAITNSFSDMILAGNHLYAAAGADGVMVYQIGSTPARPSLFIANTPVDEVTLEWSAAGTGWFLQQSEDPGNLTSWMTVTGSEAVVSTNLPMTVPARFFRLKQP